jgi:hypothetical protein
MQLGRLSLARLRPVHFAGLSVAYWIGLALVKLGGLLFATAQVALPGMHGGVNAELNNFVALRVTVTNSGGAVMWAGSTSLPVVLAWIVGPPLILALTARWARELEAGDEVGGGEAGGSLRVGAGEATTRVLEARGVEWGAADREAKRGAAERRASAREAEPRRKRPNGSG